MFYLVRRKLVSISVSAVFFLSMTGTGFASLHNGIPPGVMGALLVAIAQQFVPPAMPPQFQEEVPEEVRPRDKKFHESNRPKADKGFTNPPRRLHQPASRKKQ